MPFGLCIMPATFQRLMQAVMSDLVFQMVLIYLDDLLVYSSMFKTHLACLETVFRQLRKTGLKIKVQKMSLFTNRSEVSRAPSMSSRCRP